VSRKRGRARLKKLGLKGRDGIQGLKHLMMDRGDPIRTRRLGENEIDATGGGITIR